MPSLQLMKMDKRAMLIIQYNLREQSLNIKPNYSKPIFNHYIIFNEVLVHLQILFLRSK